MKQRIENVPLESLVLDMELYPRNDVSSETVSRLVLAIEAGVSLPPIRADKKSKRIVDGFHRYNAHKRLKLATIATEWAEYADDAELFAESIALNIGHGRPLDTYDQRRGIAKLIEYGWAVEKIAAVMRIPTVRVDELTRTNAIGPRSTVVPIKRGLSHLAGVKVNAKQREAIERYSGMEGTYHARQILLLLENGLWRDTAQFVEAMDSLVAAWAAARKAS